ncbi:hypothetical protein J4G33_11360 [Actinotalea sp. BY-33]|uniref:Uncharacterized protein n=1 Tax=Actinotalea soli TaxID=2819234 RepID=A0A939LQZ8_9CELL|nr:hypothetical protein [Actinotalea soli]MBO1752398.1 hypothetical protein [Actinotalea soli]
MPDARTRLSIVLGDRSYDLAVPVGAPLYEALRAVEIEIADPSVTVVDSTGRHVDLYGTGDTGLLDGAVLHVLRRTAASEPTRGTHGAPTTPAPSGQRGAATPVADRVAARPTTVPWWLGLAGIAAVVLTSTVVLELGPRGGPALGALAAGERWALAALLAATALAVAVTRGRPGSTGAAWPAAVAAVVAAGAGALTVDPQLAGSGRLVVVAGLGAAAIVTAARWGVLSRDRDPGGDVAAALLVVLGVTGGTCAVVLLAGLPGALAAGALLGLVPLGVRALPSMALDVPEDQLVDVSVVARTVSGVREAPPRPRGRVNDRAVRRTVLAAERRRDAGTVLLSVLAVVVAPVLLVTAPRGPLTAWTSAGAVVAVALALALQPRATRGPVARWAPRLAAATLVLQLGALGAVGLALETQVPLVLLALGVLVPLLAVPMGRGWRSVGFSRLADTLEGLSVVLALPLALTGAGAVEVLRQVTSR